jgi:hypothetical protein
LKKVYLTSTELFLVRGHLHYSLICWRCDSVEGPTYFSGVKCEWLKHSEIADFAQMLMAGSDFKQDFTSAKIGTTALRTKDCQNACYSATVAD